MTKFGTHVRIDKKIDHQPQGGCGVGILGGRKIHPTPGDSGGLRGGRLEVNISKVREIS